MSATHFTFDRFSKKKNNRNLRIEKLVSKVSLLHFNHIFQNFQDHEST